MLEAYRDRRAALKIFNAFFQNFFGRERRDAKYFFLSSFKPAYESQNRSPQELAKTGMEMVPSLDPNLFAKRLGLGLGRLFGIVRSFLDTKNYSTINVELTLGCVRTFSVKLKKFGINTEGIRARILSYSRKRGIPNDAKKTLGEIAEMLKSGNVLKALKLSPI